MKGSYDEFDNGFGFQVGICFVFYLLFLGILDMLGMR